MKPSTIEKLRTDLLACKESGLNISEYLKSINKNSNNFSTRISIFKENLDNLIQYPDILPLYESLKTSKSEDEERGMRWWVDRDKQNIITQYHIYYPIKDSMPFITTLTRQDVEILFGLYTYYGGSLTARNVANEFPKYTLAEVKKIFRVFKLTKDSSWAAPHLLEELNEEQLAQYRMAMKERAAFKYCDAQQEKDFNNQIKKMASQINKLSSYKEIAQELINTNVDINVKIPDIESKCNKTGIICLADLHIGAYNVPGGYLSLEEYNEEEINRRLDIVIDSIARKDWHKVIVLNLGDNIDSYKKMTTSQTHTLPCVLTDKEIAMMYLRIMKRFFTKLKNYITDVSYYSIGDGNHSGTVGWLNDLILSQHLKELNIESYVSNNAIDSFNLNGTSFIYLHGKSMAENGQFKGFPLNLDMKTENWFNNFFYDTDLKLNKHKVVLKGDLHQFSINSCNTFDYINCPSLYASSTYIVSNFGLTKYGCAYLEVDETGNYTIGVIQ